MKLHHINQIKKIILIELKNGIVSINKNIAHIILEHHQYIDNNDIISISFNNNSSINLIGYCKFSFDLKCNKIPIII